MAVMTKIRNQSGILLITIGGAMLLFILGDLVGSGSTVFLDNDTDVATIEGKTIDYKEFENKVQQNVELYKSRSQQLTADATTLEQIRNQTWNEYLQNLVLLEAAKNIGCNVSPDELFDLVQGANPHSSIIRNFSNPETGEFNRANVLRYLQSLEDDETGKEKQQWALFEQSIKKEQISNKYFNLVKKGLYASDIEAKRDFADKNKKLNISYVAKQYSSIPDSEITLTDADYKAYYDDHKNEPFYQQKEDARSLEYVVFEVLPSEADKKTTEETVQRLKEEFKTTNNDTLFVATNANTRNNINYYTAGSGAFPALIDSMLFNSEVGNVIGTYFDPSDNSYKLSKVLQEKFAPDSVKARHILVKIENGDTATAQNSVDSLKRLLKNGADFAKLAEDNSEDLGSAQEGGDLGWFTEGKMVPAFNDACFNGKTGDITSIISQFGVHLIEITEQTKQKKKLLIAVVDNELLPGKETYEKAYNESSSFSIKNNTTEKFKAAANEVGMRVADNVLEGDKFLSGLENPRPLIKWAYSAEVGAVSEPFELGNKFVVAHLSAIKPKGTLSLAVVKDDITDKVRNAKKAEKIKDQLQGNTLDDIASSAGEIVKTAQSVTFSSYAISGLSGEKALVGHVFGLEKGTVSEPIVGERGVYVFRVDEIIEVPENPNYSFNKTQLAQNLNNRVDYEVYKSLQDNADIDDNRAKFY